MAVATQELLQNFQHTEVAPTAYSPVLSPKATREAQLGDLASYDTATTTAIINRALIQYHSLHEQEIVEGYFPKNIVEKATELDNGILNLRATLDEAKNTEDYHRIRAKYQEADKESEGMSSEQRFAHRLSKFKRIRFVTDFDGTLSEDPESYLMHIPGSKIGERMLADHGRESFAYAAAFAWLAPLEKSPESFRQVGRELSLRPGVKEFMQNKDQLHIADITILSANFEPIPLGGLDQIGEAANGVQVIAVTPNDIRSTDKGTVLSLLALQDADTAVVFVGDGSSDEAALAAHSLIAGYGALEGAGFAKQLNAANEDGLVAPYFTYRNYHDVATSIHLANTRAQLLTKKSL